MDERPANRYSAAARHEDNGWVVDIVDPGGHVAAARACGGEREAELYASTVRQHIHWLSEPAFRRYYGLPDPP
ncbi:MAG: hypothetical protein M3245_03315 [Actinomycetota bacterium]|nr:hypothetical protein [Actinomycetota bacterium]